MKLGLIPVTVAVLLICTVALLTTTVWVYPASQGKSLHRRTESHDVRRQANPPSLSDGAAGKSHAASTSDDTQFATQTASLEKVRQARRVKPSAATLVNAATTAHMATTALAVQPQTTIYTTTNKPRLPRPLRPNTISFVFLGLWPRHGSPMPSGFRKNLESWRTHNDEAYFHVKLWSLNDILALIHTEGLFSREVVDAFNYASPIQKADLARYCILAVHGGWYFDLDTGVQCSTGGLSGCTNNLRAMLENPAFHLPQKSGALFWERGPLSARERSESARRGCRNGVEEYPLRLSNYALYARDANGLLFFRTVLELASCRVLQERGPRDIDKPDLKSKATT